MFLRQCSFVFSEGGTLLVPRLLGFLALLQSAPPRVELRAQVWVALVLYLPLEPGEVADPLLQLPELLRRARR